MIVATLEVGFDILYADLANPQGGGYDCRSDSFSGKGGEWNNIPSKIDWIRRQLQAGVETGEKP